MATGLAQLSVMHPIELDKTKFVGEALTDLRKEVSSDTAVLGFVGSPWTLATYIVEGKSSRLYKTIKLMMKKEPEILSAILTHTAEQLTEYIRYVAGRRGSRGASVHFLPSLSVIGGWFSGTTS